MDFLKKNGFWIASFVLVAAMVGTWFYATGQLKKQTDARISAINSAEGAADGVMRVEAEPDTRAHPNKTTEEGMNQKLDVLTQSVIAAWQKRYDAQKAILQWPERELGQTFISEFTKYSPPETWPEANVGKGPRLESLLDVYKQQIPSQMERICSVIQTNWKHQDQLSRVANTDQESDADADGDEKTDTESTRKPRKLREIVRWNPINQQLWLQKLTRFKGRDDNEFLLERPTPSQMYMLQQDLWLLEAMFEIIRMVNARMDDDGKMEMGPDGKPMMVQANDLAPIKAIDHVVFGREALALLGEIKDTITPAANQSTGLTARNGRGGGGRGGGRTKSQASDGSLTYLGQPAFHGRYVTANLEPIPADQIRKVVNETKLPQDNLELVVAKRVPVRLAVQMDERMIPRFLSSCANSPFAFEVWQVRINKHSSEEVIKLRGSEGGGAPAAGGRGGRGGGGGLGGPQTGGFGGGTLDETKKSNGKTTIALREDYNVGVEFYGIVKIYNPVNEELLTGKKAETATP